MWMVPHVPDGFGQIGWRYSVRVPDQHQWIVGIAMQIGYRVIG